MNGVIQLIILGYARYGRQGCLRHLYLGGVGGTGVGVGAPGGAPQAGSPWRGL